MSVSGMALNIRSSTESDTFDLAGANVATIHSTITNAFSEPFPISHMVRITFVTGGGKLCRSKYDDGAGKAVTSSLRAIGFVEDHGASCVPECSGMWKMQHDTGKNLKTIVVFPKIIATSEESSAGNGDGEPSSEPLLDLESPDYKIAVAGFTTTFPRMLSSKCPCWSQKRNAALSLEGTLSILKELNDKLMSGTPLEDNEQELFDATCTDDIERKLSYIRSEMGTQLEAGNITFGERKILLEQVNLRIDFLNQNIKEAVDNNQPGKERKLRAALDKVKARKKTANSITPKSTTVRLKHQAEIDAARLEARPLNALEDSCKGRLMSLKETQATARRDEINAQIIELEKASMGWFEELDEFLKRVEESRREGDLREKAAAKRKTAKSSTAASARGVSSRGNVNVGGKGAWSTASSKPVKKYVPTTTPAIARIGAGATKKKNTGSSGLFAAMMESDSDSD
eukprot:CAMPEP_0113297650 /NCGR_PEP_ID=MMETSP0010_2-20120614/424_1 /TAXON_ID=216773 ORGANISM="Corethron hystrix, Strain 308" /NCGR_SAMPLE_ID=MMETSP0010_2 /ASSEMBLY_ACC=CAM_ASM_000155 /LENGTH=457 /DNA_ID=CAMNT_0000150575 /DNA_START=27 /DNA_END=1400 /DNA_ORIENTATION=+ /assembly_acc=CAM_ASM_000155